MDYTIELRPQAVRDLAELDDRLAAQILRKIQRLKHDLAGDVKRLTNHAPGFRLRAGDHRVLFDIVGSRVIIQYIRHRREAYE